MFKRPKFGNLSGPPRPPSSDQDSTPMPTFSWSLKRLNPLRWIAGKAGLPQRWPKAIGLAVLVFATILVGSHISTQLVQAQTASISHPLIALSKVSVPKPPDLGTYVKNEAAAIQLGKSLFWEMQVGSDGFTSCATCHFRAGTDSRSKNNLHPGKNNRIDKGVNYQLLAGDFPFHLLSDPKNRQSTVVRSTDDVKGATGVFNTQFNSVTPGDPIDNETPLTDPIFNQNGISVRQVTGRDAPTTINAVFNHRNFWDGRAQAIFNGQTPFGLRDANARVLQVTGATSVQAVKIQIDRASLASQAVGPPLSSVEPSAGGRKFYDIGKRLSRVVPLGQQLVAFDDSVLGSLAYSTSTTPAKGLKTSYPQMIQNAFQDRWWNADVIVTVNPDGSIASTRPRNGQAILANNEYSMMDYNFALFYGLAIQLYETTLISDQAPIDRYLSGTFSALTAQQVNGKNLFEGKAKCISCHNGGEIAGATWTHILSANPKELLEKMIVGDGNQAVYDNGFYNIGVRPTAEDLGVGGLDPFGNPLSNTRLAQQGKLQALTGDSPNTSVDATTRVTVDGAFKTPTLRNIELTAPYFHNGGTLTLKQVVEFYNRGGDRRKINSTSTTAPSSGFLAGGQNCALERSVRSVSLTQPVKTAFTNRTGRTLNLYWLDYFGNRIWFGWIFNGQTFNQSTYATHPWLLADASNNSCVYLLPDAAMSSSITLNGIGKEECDTTGFGNNCSNLDADIETLGLSDSEMNDIVAFMRSFTDERVRFDRAPFDHPSLVIPNGHPAPITSRRPGDVRAPDNAVLLAAVGRNGYSTPQPNFLDPLNSSLSPTTAPQYETWTTCSQEGQLCNFTGTKKVRFGNNSQFLTKTFTNGTLCNSTTFGGDPLPGTLKLCQISDAEVAGSTTPQWVTCSSENSFCAFAGTTVVRYGANNQYITKTFTGGTDCNSAVFGGDPAPGVLKSCQYDAAQIAAAPWTFCSTENQVCNVSGTKLVRFGANGQYSTKTITSSTPCSTAVFGDPVPGVLKACEYQ